MERYQPENITLSRLRRFGTIRFLSPMMRNTASILSLEPTYEVSGQEGDITIFGFTDSKTGADSEYIFKMVKGLTHPYPKGDDND